MSRGLTPPEVERELAKLKRRVSDLERVLRGVLDNLDGPEAIFSLAGELYLASESGPYRKASGGRLVQVVAGLLVAGSEATEIELRRNGFTFETLTIPAGSLVAAVTVSQTFGPDSDYLTVEIVTAGDGAQDLVVQGRWRGGGRSPTLG